MAYRPRAPKWLATSHHILILIFPNELKILKGNATLWGNTKKKAKQSKAKQSKAKQSKAKQSKAKQSKAKQSKAKQSKVKQSKEQKANF